MQPRTVLGKAGRWQPWSNSLADSAEGSAYSQAVSWKAIKGKQDFFKVKVTYIAHSSGYLFASHILLNGTKHAIQQIAKA